MTDANSNFGTCFSAVTVADTIAPVIANCPDHFLQATNDSSCQAFVSWSVSGPSDNCQLASFNITQFGSLAPEADTVAYTATDIHGNEGICLFEIGISDIIHAAPNGSGAGTYDSPTSIERAIEVASSRGGGRVRLAGGYYQILNTINLPANTTLEGGYTALTWEKSNSTATVLDFHSEIDTANKAKILSLIHI